MAATDELDARISKIDGRLDTPLAELRILRLTFERPTDGLITPSDAHVIDFCPSRRAPRARGCYTDHWSSHRFERLGKVYVVPAGNVLHAQSDEGSQPAIICWLKDAALAQWLGQEFDWPGQDLQASLDVTQPAIPALLRRLADEARSPGLASDTLVELLFGQLAVELCRYRVNLSPNGRCGGLSTRNLRIVEERLSVLRAPPTLAELAALCGISVRQLTRGFRQSRGVSIHQEIAERRLAQAKHLLSGGASVKAVAADLGFSSTSAFCYAFRRTASLSPGDYLELAEPEDAPTANPI